MPNAQAATPEPTPPPTEPDDAQGATLESAEEPPTLRRLTYMRCPNCGVLMAGVADRYACTACETYVSYEP
ncbi:hypothetical protein SSBG_06664 [Streptomyces sp. SPB074]|nr:hypothetical protein SSBG_06664 [Streptomyces sp. SPB074]